MSVITKMILQQSGEGLLEISHTNLDAATKFSNCTDSAIRLVGGNSSNQGRLEVCMNSAWGSVCDSAGVFTSDEAKVVCRQLGILQVEGKTLPFNTFLSP